MTRRLLLDKQKLEITMKRLCFQLLENHERLNNTVIIGLQPRGVFLARRIVSLLKDILNTDQIAAGELDVTFYRDDFRRREIVTPSATKMDVVIEGKNVILLDDVLYTGRTIRAGMDALIDFGRPSKVELMVLVDRRYSRQLPIAPDYIGISVDTITSEKVNVCWQDADTEEGIWLLEQAASTNQTSNRS